MIHQAQRTGAELVHHIVWAIVSHQNNKTEIHQAPRTGVEVVHQIVTTTVRTFTRIIKRRHTAQGTGAKQVHQISLDNRERIHENDET